MENIQIGIPFLFALSMEQSAKLLNSSVLKVHKIENFFGSEFEFHTISLLVMLKY